MKKKHYYLKYFIKKTKYKKRTYKYKIVFRNFISVASAAYKISKYCFASTKKMTSTVV